MMTLTGWPSVPSATVVTWPPSSEAVCAISSSWLSDGTSISSPSWPGATGPRSTSALLDGAATGASTRSASVTAPSRTAAW
jgi:hypothetical protein